MSGMEQAGVSTRRRRLALDDDPVVRYVYDQDSHTEAASDERQATSISFIQLFTAQSRPETSRNVGCIQIVITQVCVYEKQAAILRDITLC